MRTAASGAVAQASRACEECCDFCAGLARSSRVECCAEKAQVVSVRRGNGMAPEDGFGEKSGHGGDVNEAAEAILRIVIL